MIPNFKSVTPYVIETTNYGERSIDVFTRLMKERIIFLGTAIDDQVANVVVAQLLHLTHEDSEREIQNRIYFSHVEIFNSDMEHQSKRNISDSPSDLRDLSFVLRVLGGYLDRKAAREFTISWSMNSIKLRYDQKEENFTLENLYDLGISMYLKRSDRRRTN